MLNFGHFQCSDWLDIWLPMEIRWQYDTFVMTSWWFSKDRLLRKELLNDLWYRLEIGYLVTCSLFNNTTSANTGCSLQQARIKKHETLFRFRYSMMSCSHFVQTLLHVVQSTASYILMLVFMTYNVWLCVALILGLAVGYFCFGWRKNSVVDVTEHCQ